jgi:hypothetical protein
MNRSIPPVALRWRQIFAPAIALIWFHPALAQDTKTLLRQTIPRAPTMITTMVTVGDAQRRMVLDTGTDEIVFDESLRTFLQAEEKSRTWTMGTGEARQVQLFRAPILKAQSLVIEDAIVAPVDLRDLSRYVGSKLEGILGMSALRQGKILLDYDAGVFEVHAGKWRLPFAKNQHVELLRGRDVPVFEAALGDYAVRLVIDTGSNSSIDLPASLFDALVKEGSIDAGDVESHAVTASGTHGSRQGWFLKGELMGKKLAGVSVYSVQGNEGKIGVEWLYAFNSEIDLDSRSFRYQLRSKVPPPSAVMIMLGAGLLYDENGALVSALRPHDQKDQPGAMEAAGLQEGDVIKNFGSLEPLQMNSAAIAEVVIANAGKPLRMRFLRKTDGTLVDATIQLPPLISSWDFPGREFLQKKKNGTP